MSIDEGCSNAEQGLGAATSPSELDRKERLNRRELAFELGLQCAAKEFYIALNKERAWSRAGCFPDPEEVNLLAPVDTTYRTGLKILAPPDLPATIDALLAAGKSEPSEQDGSGISS